MFCFKNTFVKCYLIQLLLKILLLLFFHSYIGVKPRVATNSRFYKAFGLSNSIRSYLAQYCNLSPFCHIAFFNSILYDVTSDSLYSHDFLYVSAESNPVILAKQSQNGARFNHSSDIAVLPWCWQHHRQVSWTLPSRYIHSEMTHSLSMIKYIWHWNILHIFYSDRKKVQTIAFITE